MGESKNYSKEEAERIKQTAYEIWEKEGRKAGHDLDYWLKAEKTVHSQQYNIHYTEQQKQKGTR